MLEEGEKLVSHAWRSLNDKLSDSKSVWQDDNTREFMTQYWHEIETILPQLIVGLQELDHTLRAVNSIIQGLDD